MLGEGPIDDIKDSIGTTEKMFDINFIKANTKHCLSSHCDSECAVFVC